MRAAKILAKENLFPPTLYHLRQDYEKCIKSYYIFRSSTGVTEKTTYKKCKDLGHNTEEITIKLLAVLTQMNIDAMQKARRRQPNPDELRIIDEGLAAIKGFKALICRMVTRNNLRTSYIKNVKNYLRSVRRSCDYNQKSSSGELILGQPGQILLLIDIAAITLYQSLYKMEDITRYPHADFTYDNLDLLCTNMEQPCQKIIEMMNDLFSLVKTACKLDGRNILNLPS